jgi:hypothetical protein
MAKIVYQITVDVDDLEWAREYGLAESEGRDDAVRYYTSWDAKHALGTAVRNLAGYKPTVFVDADATNQQ